MQIMLQTRCAKHFCRFFFFLNYIKVRPARKKDGKLYMCFFFLLLVAQLVLRTDAIPSSRVFIRHALCGQKIPLLLKAMALHANNDKNNCTKLFFCFFLLKNCKAWRARKWLYSIHAHLVLQQKQSWYEQNWWCV